jgi:haloacetate dehalogenase
MAWFDGFTAAHHKVNRVEIFARQGGLMNGQRRGPPLLLLHGFPQTHVLWNRVAHHLSQHFFLVIPDLRGYGDSAKPAGDADHANYSKRAMAQDMAALMAHLGFDSYGVVGHDRGGRVAHRLALDHAHAVNKLCVIDIAPTLDMYNATDMRFASAYYHWFHLIQPAPLPERMIGADAAFYLNWTLGGWGASLTTRGTDYIEAEALREYHRCFCTPQAIHAACEDYRASAGIDLEHDRASRAAGQKVACDLLLLWGERGVVNRLFDPLALWRAQCSGRVAGQRMPAGHFIPEEQPEATALALREFFA